MRVVCKEFIVPSSTCKIVSNNCEMMGAAKDSTLGKGFGFSVRILNSMQKYPGNQWHVITSGFYNDASDNFYYKFVKNNFMTEASQQLNVNRWKIQCDESIK